MHHDQWAAQHFKESCDNRHRRNGIFLIKGETRNNIQAKHNPLTVNMPIGATTTSSHACELDILGLPKSTCKGHIVPDLTHASVLGVQTLCNAGCKVVLDDDEYRVYYNRKIVLRGFKGPTTDLWVTALNNPNPRTTPDYLDLQTTHSTQRFHEIANHVYFITTKQNTVKYMHQSMCSPMPSTLLKAIKIGHLDGVPHLNEKSV